MSVRLKGVNELKLALRNKADMGAVKQIVKHNGSGLQARAQRNVPVKTGNLKRSIQLEISDGGLLAKSEATAEYAPYVEWGTRYRTEERRVWKESRPVCRSRWSPYN